LRVAINAWFVDQPTTGSGQYLVHLLQAYAARSLSDRFLLLVGSKQRIPASLTSLGPSFEWGQLRTPLDGQHRYLAKLWFEQVCVPRACRAWGATLLHVPYWASPLYSPVPAIVTVHDLIPLLLPAYRGGLLGRLYTSLVARTARRTEAVLTDSEASRADIVRELGIPVGRVRAIHLAAEDRFQPIADPAMLTSVRDRLGLPGRYLLYLGGFDVRKNVGRILQAFARLKADDVQLVIAGRLPARDTPFAPAGSTKQTSRRYTQEPTRSSFPPCTRDSGSLHLRPSRVGRQPSSLTEAPCPRSSTAVASASIPRTLPHSPQR
jgi:glycosyltransferase involved in cell wall biosynthesis